MPLFSLFCPRLLCTTTTYYNVSPKLARVDVKIRDAFSCRTNCQTGGGAGRGGQGEPCGWVRTGRSGAAFPSSLASLWGHHNVLLLLLLLVVVVCTSSTTVWLRDKLPLLLLGILPSRDEISPLLLLLLSEERHRNWYSSRPTARPEEGTSSLSPPSCYNYYTSERVGTRQKKSYPSPRFRRGDTHLWTRILT